ncbi:hypothetical protein Tco_0223970 [Tanacetum coccineum]
MQNGHVLKEQSDDATIKFDLDEVDTKNIELKHAMASLHKENEHLNLTYPNLFDSIKRSRVQKKSSNVTQNVAENLKSQLSEFGDKKFDKVFQKAKSMKKKMFDSQITSDFLQKSLYNSDVSNVQSESGEKKYKTDFEKLKNTRIVLEQQLDRESSKSFPKRVSQFTTHSLQKDRKFSKKPQAVETPTSKKVVSLVDVVLDGAFGGVEEEEVVVGDGVERFSLSLVRSTNSYFGGMIVSLIFFNPWEEDAYVSMEV